MTLFGAMYGPGDNGRAPTRVRESFTQNMAKGKSGKLGQLQAIDVLQEETIREVVRAGTQHHVAPPPHSRAALASGRLDVLGETQATERHNATASAGA